MLEESTRDHAIDVASRRMALDALAGNLCGGRPAYLDAGCSTGWLVEDVRWRHPAAWIVGADPFLSGLRKLRGRLGDVRTVQFDLCRAPFAGESFDAISCLNVLEHIEEDVQALRQIRRMLKPDGGAFIMVPAGPGLFDYYDEVHQHVRRYGCGEFQSKLAAAGLTVRRLSYLGVLLYPAFYAAKKMGQWKMRGKTMDEKRQQVLKNIGRTSGSWMAGAALALERKLSAVLPQRFGIRLCASVRRAAA